MFCINCGNEVLESGKFCPHCGGALPEVKTEPIAEAMPEQVEQPVREKKKKKWALIGCGGCLGIVIIGAIIIGIATMWLYSGDYEESSEFVDIGSSVTDGSGHWGTDLGLTDLRDFYTTLKDDGSDVATVMVYLLGSNLESDGGYASNDLGEMLAADFGDNLNLIVMTGGAKEWQNENISSSTCQYWQIKDGELISLESDIGKISMTDSDTLSTFISYAASEYPADRYALICWDHGGGTMDGYGSDEYFEDDALNLDDIAEALGDAGVLFDFVGFDACLMGTVETAYMLEPYADYLIASEEIEECDGWYYTDWLTELGSNPSISTVDLGVKIIDDFVESYQDDTYELVATLSIVELRQMPYTYEVMCAYFADATIALEDGEYSTLSTARSSAKAYGEDEFEQVDIVDFVMRTDLDGSQDVIDAVDSAVKYYRNSVGLTGSGMAMYFPYDYPDCYTDVLAVLQDVGYTEEYTTFFNQFVSAMSGGQTQYGISTGTMESDEQAEYADNDWYDSDMANYYASSYNEDLYTELVIVEKGDGFVLQLSDEQWEEIIYIEQQVLLDDGEGYIDLGSDNMYEIDEDGDLLIEFDYTWVTLDGHTVPFYAEVEEEFDDGSWVTYGIVPAMLNSDEYIEIIVYWSDEVPEGYVAGYRKYSGTGTPMGKGLFQLSAGDKVEWVFDYYTYDGEYEDSYIMGDVFTVSSSDIEVSYDYVGDQDAMVYFSLTDIYNNVYESEAVLYTDE